MDLRQLTKIARRWWWLLLLAPMIAGFVAYYTASQQTPLYSSTVTLRVNPPAGRADDLSALQLTQNLTETYRQLLVTSPVLQLVVDELELPYDVDLLKENSSAAAISNTQLLRLSVSDPDPGHAALIANTTALMFIEYLNEQMKLQYQGTQTMLAGELNSIQQRLDTVQAEIAQIEGQGDLQSTAIANQLETLIMEETQLIQQRTALQLQAQTLGIGIASSQAQVTVSEPAEAPNLPYAPRVPFYTLLGVFLGCLLAIGGVALLEYLDNTVREETSIPDLTGSVLLAGVDNVKDLAAGPSQIFVLSNPHSAATEAIRLLRANLEFAAVSAPLRSLAITSVGPGDGKSTVTANLAVVLAQAGLTTILVDADLRKPSQQNVFGVPNRLGLSTLLTHPQREWQSVAQSVAVPNLFLISSGPIPPNPADLIGAERFQALLRTLENDADIVLVDTPPVQPVSDPLLIGTKVNGMILLGRAGHTKRESLAHAAETLRSAGVRLVGVVLNRRTARDAGYYHYYYGEPPASLPPDEPGSAASRLGEGGRG